MTGPVPFTTSAFKATDTPTARTIPDRLAEFANVRDYGATGDGVTDDWAAIMAAFNRDTVTLIATAPSSGAVMTFASVPATIKGNAGHYAVDETNPDAIVAGRAITATTGTTVTVTSLAETVQTGDVITCNRRNRGLLYFPPGTYYVSAPIDVGGLDDGEDRKLFHFLGQMGASTIVGDFADHIIKLSHPNGNSFAGFRFIEKLTLINRHLGGGGIRLGASIGSAIRDCDITADCGIDTLNVDEVLFDGPTGFYAGSLDQTIENCHMRAYNALSAGSYGLAKSSNGITLNCTFKDFETGARCCGGQGQMPFLGCYFEHNTIGLSGDWAPGQDENFGPSRTSGTDLLGCHLKDNGIAISATATTSHYAGVFIEATEGSIAGNPQYGIHIPAAGGGCIYSAITITGQYQVAGFALAGAALRSTSSADGISVSNTSTLGGVDWVLPTIASAVALSSCNVAPVYTMAHLPAFPIDIASASWSAGVTTLHVYAAVSGLDGTPITVAVEGVTPSGYNGTFTGVTVTGVDALSYAQSDPGSPTASGGPIIGALIYNVAHSAREGDCYNASDASTAVWGDIPIGGGANHVKLRWGANDAAWTVIGK